MVDPETRHRLYCALWDIHRGVADRIGIPLKPSDKPSHLDEKVEHWLADQRERGTEILLDHWTHKPNRTYWIAVRLFHAEHTSR